MTRRNVLWAAAAATALAASAAAAGEKPAPALRADRLVALIPADTPEAKAKLQEHMDLLDGDAIVELCRRLKPPKEGGDARLRYAIHGLATHFSTRPEKRKLFAEALSRALSKAPDHREVKAFLIRQLQFCGGPEAEATLNKYLLDEQLCEPAVQALLAIGAKPDGLRAALPKSGGKTRATLAQALGVLADADAAPELKKLLGDKDRDVRLAAMFALARIGQPGSAEALLKATAARDAHERIKAADCCLLLAERLVQAGRKPQAEKICRRLWETHSSGEQVHVRCGALRGLAAAGCVDEVLAAMKSKDRQLAAVAADLAATLGGKDATARLIEQMKDPSPQHRVKVLGILARRSDRSALPAAASAMSAVEERVRLAGIAAAGALGDEKTASALLEVLSSGSDPERKAARHALLRIPGKPASRTLAHAAAKADAPLRCELLGILGARRASEHADLILAAARDKDEAVGLAALNALGMLAEQKTIPPLLALLAGARSDARRQAAEQALLAASRAVGAPAAAPAAALAEADAPTKCSLLRVLGRLGGPKALAAVRAAVNDVILSRLAGIREPAALQMARAHLNDAPCRREAAAAVVRIARDVWRQHPEKTETALKEALAATTSKRVINDARKLLREIEKRKPKK